MSYQAGIWVVVCASAFLCAACGGESSSEAEATVGAATLEARLRALEYPFIGEHGELVCASYEFEVGDEIFREDEFYHLERIEERIANDAALRAYVSRHDLARVGSCDEARKFMALKLELEGLSPPADETEALPAPVEEGGRPLTAPIAEAPIEKIIDGQTYSHAPTVFLRFFRTGSTFICTGTLIGPREVLTAAHCSTFDGPQAVTVQYWDGTCISHADCEQAPGSGELADFQRTDNFPGSWAVADDVAVLIGPSNWSSPATVMSAVAGCASQNRALSSTRSTGSSAMASARLPAPDRACSA